MRGSNGYYSFDGSAKVIFALGHADDEEVFARVDYLIDLNAILVILNRKLAIRVVCGNAGIFDIEAVGIVSLAVGVEHARNGKGRLCHFYGYLSFNGEIVSCIYRGKDDCVSLLARLGNSV